MPKNRELDKVLKQIATLEEAMKSKTHGSTDQGTIQKLSALYKKRNELQGKA